MMNCVFVQIDTKLINANVPDDIAAKYYNTFWNNKESDGFYRPDSFWEIPVWIAELCYTLPDDWGKELYIVKDVIEAITDLSNPGIDYIFFSCMDSNRQIIEKIISRTTTKAIVGGYVKPDLTCYHWFESIYEFCCVMGIDYRYGTDYSLFANYRTIPRLTLSTGCTHTCKFCTVENEIVTKSVEDVTQQIDSFKPLDFELVYLNDKTFGQAKNYRWLDYLSDHLEFIKPDFKGFIVQTTASQICKPGFVDDLKQCNVKYVELGIESFNDGILQAMNKPSSVKLLHRAIMLLNGAGIKVIGNIIIGLPGETMETYRHTVKMLQWYEFYSLNIYNLVLYSGTELGDYLQTDETNENDKNRSYHTESDREAIDWFYEEIYKLGLKIVGE